MQKTGGWGKRHEGGVCGGCGRIGERVQTCTPWINSERNIKAYQVYQVTMNIVFC